LKNLKNPDFRLTVTAENC